MSTTTSNQILDCRKVLAAFFSSIKDTPARWFNIILKEGTNNNTRSLNGLWELMRIPYNDMYLSLMIQCGLVFKYPSNRWGNAFYTPSISTGKFNKSGYTWDMFISEYMLQSDIEIASVFINGYKGYYIRVGEFTGPRFTVADQLKRNSVVTRSQSIPRDKALTFLQDLASISTHVFSLSLLNTQSNNANDGTAVDIGTSDTNFDNVFTSDTIVDNSITSDTSVDCHFKTLLQVYFFEHVLKPDKDCSKLWEYIDVSKLKDGLRKFIPEVQKYYSEEAKRNIGKISGNSLNETGDITLKPNALSDFPVLTQYGIPLDKFSISSVIRDIVKLNSLCEDYILTFKYYNDAVGCLVQVPKSISYDQLKKNSSKTRWFDQMFDAIGATSRDEAATWVAEFIGDKYAESFNAAAANLGVLLTGKKMDAASSCAMWEEANVPLRGQRIILRHLASHFGRRLTVPEYKIRELESGALPPVADKVEIGGETVTFWYRMIDEAVKHRLKIEVKHKGYGYFKEKGYDLADVVFGGDTGARRFRAVCRFIIRNSKDNTVPSISTVITVGNIDSTMDSREVLEKTIGTHLNDSLKRIFGKYLVLHINANDSMVLLSDEPPSLEPAQDIRSLSLSTRVFITGDLAFFQTILGKENMATCWCTWCMLSPKEWSVPGHAAGESWTLEKIHGVRDKVANGILSDKEPSDIRGITKRPLIDAVPVENFIVSVLHIIIGMGNTMTDGIIEWLESRVEKLQKAEIEARNRIIYATIQLEEDQKKLEVWLENDGILLTEYQLEKKRLKDSLAERVGDIRSPFVIPSNSSQRRFYNNRYKELVALVKTIEAEKRELNKEISNKRASVKNAKAKEVEVKNLLGKQSNSETLVRTLEKVFERHCISKPYYHGGKYNGKSMVNFMTNSGRIMDDIKEALLGIDQGSRYCDDAEIVSFTEKYKYVLQVFDGVFSKCRIASCHITENDVKELQNFVTEAMRLWRGLQLNITPKAHAVDDHLCDQVRILSGIGDLTEDFVEQSHQTGIRHNQRSRCMKDNSKSAKWHVGWEEKETNPAVVEKINEVQGRSTRKKRTISAGGEISEVDISRKEEKKTRIDNEKRNVRMTALTTTMECEGVYCRSGRQRNKDDFLVMMSKARDRITALCRGRKVRKLSIKLKKSTIIITKVCRGKMARNITKRIRDAE